MAEKSKTDRIRTFLGKNPEATWKDAAASLEKYGVSGPYFSMVKSKVNQKAGTAEGESAEGGASETTAATPAAGKRGRKPKSATVATSNHVMEKALQFAKSVGDIDAAVDALKQLQAYQIK